MTAIVILCIAIVAFVAGAWLVAYVLSDEIHTLQEALDAECARSGLLEQRLTDVRAGSAVPPLVAQLRHDLAAALDEIHRLEQRQVSS